MSHTTAEVIILHGWSRAANPSIKWQPVVTLLQQAGITTSVLKLPGFELPLDRPWGVDAYIHWLAKQLSNKQNLVLVGHSFGGHLAAVYAARFPDRVEKLVLIASAGFVSHSFYSRLKRSGFYHLAKLGKRITTSSTLRTLLYRLAGERDYLQANSVMKETMRRVITHEIDGILPKITVPTTIIWGDNDTITPLEFTDRLLAGIPHTKLQLIAGAKHGLPFTHSKQVANYILEALDD